MKKKSLQKIYYKDYIHVGMFLTYMSDSTYMNLANFKQIAEKAAEKFNIKITITDETGEQIQY